MSWDRIKYIANNRICGCVRAWAPWAIPPIYGYVMLIGNMVIKQWMEWVSHFQTEPHIWIMGKWFLGFPWQEKTFKQERRNLPKHYFILSQGYQVFCSEFRFQYNRNDWKLGQMFVFFWRPPRTGSMRKYVEIRME